VAALGSEMKYCNMRKRGEGIMWGHVPHNTRYKIRKRGHGGHVPKCPVSKYTL